MITPAQIEQKVKEIIAQKLGLPIEQVQPESRLIEDLKVDSFGAVELMFEIEEAFGLNIPDSDLERVRSVQDIVGYVTEWLAKKAADGAPEVSER